MLLRVLLIVAVWLPVIFCAGDGEPHKEEGAYRVYYEPDNTTLSEQLLSTHRVPLRVRLASPIDVESLIWAIRLLDAKRGQCPRLGLWEMLRVAFEMLSLEDIYGVERLETLQRLLSDAESNDGTDGTESWGQVELELPEGGGVLMVHLGDIVLQHLPGWKQIVQVNMVTASLRHMRGEKRRQMRDYTQKVWENHQRLRRLQQLDIQRARQRHIEVARERSERLALMKQGSEWRRNITEHVKRERPVILLLDTKKQDGPSFAHRAGRCENIRHAIHTLQSQRVLPTERRMRYLREKEKKVCGDVFYSLEDLARHEEHEMCHSRCSSYCEGVEALENWTRYTGSAASVVQLHALYHNVLLSTTDFNDTAVNYFSLLFETVLDDVDRGVFSTCAELCIPSKKVVAEMKFFAGVLGILDHTPEANAGVNKLSAVWWDRARHAYLHIWDASRAGSRRATAALATMKEHGILAQQQRRVAAVLLSTLLLEKHAYFWRQVMSVRAQSSGEAVPSSQRLLRFERFFAEENGWRLVNEPFLTRNRIKAFRSEIDEEDDTESSVPPDEIPLSILQNIFLAQLHIAGIKGVPRDLKRAECLLLLLLRKLRYTCDAPHLEELDKKYFSEDGGGGACEEHFQKLYLLRRSGISMGPCGLLNATSGFKLHPSLRLIRSSKKIHEVVHRILVLLAYIHLLNGLQYDMAAKYAFLALEVSAAVFFSATAELPKDVKHNFVVGNISHNEKLVMLKNKNWPAKDLLMNALRRGDPLDSLFDFTRSGFLSSESLVLLAMSAFRGGVAAQRYICFTTERFFGARSCVEKSGRAPCRTQWTFFLLREASRLWADEAKIPGILDRSYPSPRLVDAFFLMASLLKGGKITVDDIREGELFTSPRYASGGSPPFQPSGSDTSESYRNRLLRFARRVSPFALPGRRVMVYAKNWQYFITRATPPRKLRVLRAAVQSFLEEHDINPLLAVSDMHDYLDGTRWSWLQGLFGTLWDAVLYPFAQTRAEAIEDQLVREVLPKKTLDAEPVNITERLAASVLSSRHIREATIALQLLTTALVSGEPDGFTLILLEEMERGNGHLRSFAHFISEHVWGESLVNVWMEEHKAAQWHHAKPKTRGRGPIFAADSRIPFYYALPDSRLELFAQIALKLVKTRQKYAMSSGCVTAHSNCTVFPEINQEIIRTMALCSGVLIETAVRKGRSFMPRKPYEGMYFPVGSLRCLQGLLQYVQTTGISPFSGLSAKAAELLLLDLLVELAKAQAQYYDLSLDALGSSSRSGSDAADANQEDAKKNYRKYLVEPWRRFFNEGVEEIPLPGVGEGAYYNKRLHRVTGTYYAARMLRWYARTKIWLEQFFGVA
ncbi:hypothetical protein ECC02_003899 [Trypanosoma cruzi]|uniref:Clu domain-containing protein n=2 Tax=Trypanosoma cruzi TaxID=5693 RepID=A0A7J6Y930_TRYCR|nr:hypothetical protein ECC02_003899 [Trypanosoma cruzi]